MRFGTTSPSVRTASGWIVHEVIVSLFNETVETARARGHLSGEHFSVDGTFFQAWAGHKSFVPKTKSDDDSPPEGDTGSQEELAWREAWRQRRP